MTDGPAKDAPLTRPRDFAHQIDLVPNLAAAIRRVLAHHLAYRLR